MCGRFALHSLIEDLQQHFGLFDEVTFKPSYNVAPSLNLPVVRLGEEHRHMALCRWGLIPGWSNSLPKTRPINARAETVAAKPFFRNAFQRHRCLVPANGFYEWKRTPRGKEPFYFRLKDAALFSFAGLWDRWEGGGDPIDTFAIITTAANDAMRPVHDRMPVILDSDQYNRWLGSGGTDLLVPYAGEMTRHAISRRVNSPANDDERLIEPVT